MLEPNCLTVNILVRAKVSASDFASDWAATSFRLNSTVAVGNFTFNPEYNESNVYTTVEFPTISSSPSADAESDALSVKYILSTNSSFTSKIDSSTVVVSSSIASWQPSIDPSDNQQYWIKALTYDGYEYGAETDASTFILNNENMHQMRLPYYHRLEERKFQLLLQH